MSEERRLTFTYNKVILDDPEAFQARMESLEQSFETEFRKRHPTYCWNYPTAIAWLEIQSDDIMGGFRVDFPSNTVLCEYADGCLQEMVVRIANRINDDRPKRIPIAQPEA